MIQTKNLYFSYKNRLILNGIDLNIPQGSLYGYLGKNGAGKTTTLKLLLGLLPAEKDKIFYAGNEFSKNRIAVLESIGNLIETPSLYKNLTCEEQLRYVDYFYKKGQKRIDEILEIIGLSSERKTKVKYCSTGMKQRLAIGVALFHNPDILILDEPMNGLDPNGIYDVREILLSLHRMGKTILFSSHILSEVEKTCSHIGILDKGNLLYQGDISSLLSSCQRKITIYTSDNEKSVRILSENEIHATLENPCFSLTIHDDFQYNKIIQLLAGKSIEIYNIESQENHLEDIFITLTNKSHA